MRKLVDKLEVRKVKLGMFKKFNLIITILLFFLIPSKSYAGFGSGELKLSEQSVYQFQRYLQKKYPSKFFISIDGKTTHWWYCPEPQCQSMGSTQEEKRCTAAAGGVQCKTFAVRRNIKWYNGKSAKALKIKFTSKDSIQEIKDKLTQLGFYGDRSINSSSSKSDDKKSSNNITERLKTLNNMYKKGFLTEEEFKKAKQKLLN